jgi:hydroxyacylglutathione hydrolase
LILDTRKPEDFVKGFIPDSLFIGLDGTFAPWVGALIDELKRPIIFIADEGSEEEVVIRLARVGYDNTLGYLKGGFETWKKSSLAVDTIDCITPKELEIKISGKPQTLNILDVRRPTEYEAEHLENAVSRPLDFIRDNINTLDKKENYYIYCAGGYRSVIESSILRSHGYKNIVNIVGGFEELKKTRIPKTEFVCQSGN